LVFLTNKYDAGGGCQFTGVIIEKNKILTAAHGCAKPGQITGIVRYRKKTKEVSMKVIKISHEKDLALLEFSPSFDRKPTVITKRIIWGKPVIYGGFNSLKTPKLRFGIATMSKRGTMVHPAWYGDSGGPMMNTKNELIGIIYQMSVAVMQPYQDYVYTLVGYAMPLETIKEFLK